MTLVFSYQNDEVLGNNLGDNLRNNLGNNLIEGNVSRKSKHQMFLERQERGISDYNEPVIQELFSKNSNVRLISPYTDTNYDKPDSEIITVEVLLDQFIPKFVSDNRCINVDGRIIRINFSFDAEYMYHENQYHERFEELMKQYTSQDTYRKFQEKHSRR